MLKIRRPLGRLIFNMGIAIPGKTVFLIETAPWVLCIKLYSGEQGSILTHWGRDKMDAIWQTMLSNALFWVKMLEFRLKFHWSLFLRVQLTIFQHWFWYWFGADQATSHYLNQWWLDYWRIYASLGLNELRIVLTQNTFPMGQVNIQNYRHYYWGLTSKSRWRTSRYSQTLVHHLSGWTSGPIIYVQPWLIPQDTINHDSTLVQVMTWCPQASRHYLNQCLPSSIMPYVHDLEQMS